MDCGWASVHKPVSSLLVALTGFPTKSLSCLLADTRWRPFIVPAAGPWLGLFASTFGPRYQAALFDRREYAIKWTRLSCRKFRNNEVRLQLHALAYNLANFMRTLALPKEVEHWSLTTLREKLVKIG